MNVRSLLARISFLSLNGAKTPSPDSLPPPAGKLNMAGHKRQSALDESCDVHGTSVIARVSVIRYVQWITQVYTVDVGTSRVRVSSSV